MGWKIVRNGNQKLLQGHMSGQWRISPDPVSALVKKLGEEYGEFAEHRDPAELQDLLDVIEELSFLLDRDSAAARAHQGKLDKMGDFSDHLEWNPLSPELHREWNPGESDAPVERS